MMYQQHRCWYTGSRGDHARDPTDTTLLVIFGALAGFTAYSYLVRHVRPAPAAGYAYVNPVVALLLGVTLAGDPFSRVGLFAMPIILSGVVPVRLGRERS
jgi:drug/metabolite transporter (DMT)-like permease